MFDRLRRDWRLLRGSAPGSRFEERYRRRRREPPPAALSRIFRIALGIVLVPVGIFLWFVPGPGWLTIFLGLALLAVDSKTLSRFLDWMELRIRRTADRFRSRPAR